MCHRADRFLKVLGFSTALKSPAKQCRPRTPRKAEFTCKRFQIRPDFRQLDAPDFIKITADTAKAPKLANFLIREIDQGVLRRVQTRHLDK